MENFSLVNLLFLSTPEFFLSLMFSLVVVGARNKVPLRSDKEVLKNLLKMLGASLTVAVLACIADMYMSNMMVSAAAKMVIYILIIKKFYLLSWKKAFIGTLAFSMLLITLEAMYTPFCLKMFFNGSQTELFGAPEIKRILCALPIKVGQVIAIASAWNLHLTIEKMKFYKLNVRVLILSAFVLFFFELSIMNIYVSYFEVFNIVTRITLGLICLFSGIFNFTIPLICVRMLTQVSNFFVKKVI